jgi:hypothetical protein
VCQDNPTLPTPPFELSPDRSAALYADLYRTLAATAWKGVS